MSEACTEFLRLQRGSKRMVLKQVLADVSSKFHRQSICCSPQCTANRFISKHCCVSLRMHSPVKKEQATPHQQLIHELSHRNAHILELPRRKGPTYLLGITFDLTKPCLCADVGGARKIELWYFVEGLAAKPGVAEYVSRAQKQGEMVSSLHELQSNSRKAGQVRGGSRASKTHN